ncbi:putative membrane protein (plasmid) [Borreliella bissettiae DN127]|uniref:Membrane protein n=1 Tax=Borrelia bissettiae (strain DSM 17990 / CIP 109136 / DN127) TaxID=521010 RepID=G0AP68_BORBD|nr:putative membrane protein [Borreliella bissettiae DN127]
MMISHSFYAFSLNFLFSFISFPKMLFNLLVLPIKANK